MNKPSVQDWMYLAINLLYIMWVVSEQEDTTVEDVEIKVWWRLSQVCRWSADLFLNAGRTLDRRIDVLLERRRTV